MKEFLWNAKDDRMKAAGRGVFNNLDPAKTYRVEVSEYRVRWSDAQNRWYWGAVMPLAAVELAKAFGGEWDEDAADALLRSVFFGRDVVNPRTGELMGSVVRALGSLSPEEFSTYIDNVRQWLAEKLGCLVPSPASCVPPSTKP